MSFTETSSHNKVFSDLMKKHNKLYKIWRIFDLVTVSMALLGLLIACIEYELGFIYYHKNRNTVKVERSAMRYSKFVKSLIII